MMPFVPLMMMSKVEARREVRVWCDLNTPAPVVVSHSNTLSELKKLRLVLPCRPIRFDGVFAAQHPRYSVRSVRTQTAGYCFCFILGCLGNGSLPCSPGIILERYWYELTWREEGLRAITCILLKEFPL